MKFTARRGCGDPFRLPARRARVKTLKTHRLAGACGKRWLGSGPEDAVGKGFERECQLIKGEEEFGVESQH